MSHALIIDADTDAAEMMAALVAGEKFTVSTAHTLRDVRRQIARQQPDIVLLGLQQPADSGMELFADPALLAQSEVVLIAGHARLDNALQALRLGAADCLIKPVNSRQLHGILARVTRPAVLQAEIEALEAEWERAGHFADLWGRSEVMQRIYRQISQAAGCSLTVLLSGESSTGKEVVARTVHELSRRRHGPFLAVNCGAISPNLIESEIFGLEKGSFTGADRQHPGCFERAHGGTLFVDEITDMPLQLQVKLLHVLETGRFMCAGSTQSREADVRIIAATTRSPEQAVAMGRLREDLYYRLNIFPIAMPALRERPEDVGLLAEHFLSAIGDQEGRAKHFSAAALARLAGYRWPGNVSELRNVVQRAYVMAAEDVISDEWLPSNGLQTDIDGDSESDGAPDAARITIPLGISMADAEYQLILATLKHCNNHRERTAAVLGVSLKTLYNRLKEYGSGATPFEEAADPDSRRQNPDRRQASRNPPPEN